MDRLTKRTTLSETPYVTGDDCFDTWSVPATFMGNAIDRLAAYEDAEQDGRLVALPCKVGDTVYFIPQYGGKPSYGVQEGHAQHVMLSKLGWRIRIRENHPHNIDYALGKAVFLTREEAEAALKGDSHDNT